MSQRSGFSPFYLFVRIRLDSWRTGLFPPVSFVDSARTCT